MAPSASMASTISPGRLGCLAAKSIQYPLAPYCATRGIPAAVSWAVTSRSNGLSSVWARACVPTSAPPDAAYSKKRWRIRGALGGELGGVHVEGGEGRDKRHAPLGPGDGDVQGSVSPLPVDGSEVVVHPPVARLAVPDRDDDGIALVALDALQVLNEHRLIARSARHELVEHL